MANTYSDSITTTTTKPSAAGTIITKPTTSGTVTAEPYVGLYALLTENSYEILFEDQSTMNMENL
jgi:hypothetical protein